MLFLRESRVWNHHPKCDNCSKIFEILKKQLLVAKQISVIKGYMYVCIVMFVEPFACEYTVKKTRRFYGKIPSICLPLHLPLLLRFYGRLYTCRTFLEIMIW